MIIDDRSEWLEPDGLGGFASGTASGVRTRRYHALLLHATTPPTGRLVLVNGFDAHVQSAGGVFALTTQRYVPEVLHPDGASRITSFSSAPWPTWTYQLPDGTQLRHEILTAHGTGIVLVSWTLVACAGPIELRARPFLSGRDYHSMHHENSAFNFDARWAGDHSIVFTPYEGVPSIQFKSNGEYDHAPDWYRNFAYTAERERGLDAVEDLASPGAFRWQLNDVGDRAIWMMSVPEDSTSLASMLPGTGETLAPGPTYDAIRAAERERRAAFSSPLDRAADAYLVRRGAGRTIVAGYPWFTDWGRDTFIALRGLCLATGRIDEARSILVEWAGAVSEGMLPNRFPDRGEAPEFNSVDAALWFIVAAWELMNHASVATETSGARSGDEVVAIGSAVQTLNAADRTALETAVLEIVDGYARGTRFGIRMDDDGLLAAGAAGLQLTWMDARVGDRVITPRIGKPVEIQALWLNALAIATNFDARWRDALTRGQASFTHRFWTDSGFLADLVDVDHVRGTRDEVFRPNQILAVGGLPYRLVTGERARSIVDLVERRLVTPLGLRSLAPEEPGYAPRYLGGPAERDAVYHQGTVWPWLIGAFVDAWVHVHGDTMAVRHSACARFLDPLKAHLSEDGLGHVSEIADATAPFVARGCPFQAWSLGELIRIERVILKETHRARPRHSREPAWA